MNAKVIFFILINIYSLSSFALNKADVDKWLEYAGLSSESLTGSQYNDYAKQIKVLEKSKFRLPDKRAYQKAANEFEAGVACATVDDWFNSYDDLFKYDGIMLTSFKNSDSFEPKCRKKILKEYLKEKFAAKDPRRSKHCKKSNCELINAMYGYFEKTVAELIYDQFGYDDLEYYCSQKEKINSSKDIKNLLEAVDEINSCSDTEVGGTKIINNTLNGITQKYAMTRDSENKYTISFNLNFFNAANSGDRAITDDEKMVMHNEINTCLEQRNPFLKDGRGKQLNLKVMSPAETSRLPTYKKPPIVNVGIDFNNTRAHSKRYTWDIGCSTIVHELLHLTGLHDEYSESAFGKYVHKKTGKVIRAKLVSDEYPRTYDERQDYEYTADYNHCRAIPEKPSIMANDRVAFTRVLPSKTTCSCDPDKPSELSKCKEHFSKIPEKYLSLYINSTNALPESTISNFNRYQHAGLCQINGRKTSHKFLSSFEELENFKYFEKSKREGSKLIITKYSYRSPSEFDGKFGRIYTFVSECECKDSKEGCDILEKKVNNVYENPSDAGANSCPVYTVPTHAEEGKRGTEGQDIKNGIIMINSPVDYKGPILRNAHLERIISGDCKSKVKRYSECGKYSYVRLEEKCNRPKYCEDESLWLDSVE